MPKSGPLLPVQAPLGRQPTPHSRCVQLLANGHYSVMLTEAGGGWSRWRDLAITRWREDPTGDDWGSHVLLRDVDGGSPWSPTIQPLGVAGGAAECNFGAGRAAFTSSHNGLEATLEVAVAGDCDGEVRRITLRNTGNAPRTVELTSYAELVLGPAAADASHPAFSKMFVQTHWDPDQQALLATRRKRSPEESDAWAAHCIVSDAIADDGQVSYETDRARFLGRGNHLANAAAMREGGALSNTVGTVLDPVFSLRTQVIVAVGATVIVDFWTQVASGREAVLDAMRRIQSGDAAARAISECLSRAQSRGQDQAEGAAWTALLAPLLYADADWRANDAVLRQGTGGPPVLWRHGISGDRPILLLRVAGLRDLPAAESLLRAQRCWREDGVGMDIVLLDASAAPDDALRARLEALQDSQDWAFAGEGVKSQIFVLHADALDTDFRDGLETAARVVLQADGASWRKARAEEVAMDAARARLPVARSIAGVAAGGVDGDRPSVTANVPDVEFHNGIGGFSAQGSEFRIVLEDGDCTPTPWSNVVSNPEFGFLVTAEGGGYTWSCNSQQNPLTPWPNDPVTDAQGEIIYLQDQDSGALWTATPSPIRVQGSQYVVVHGKGWTRHAHRAHGIDVELLQFVPVKDSIKLSRLRLHNRSDRTRTLCVTGYVQWALAPNGNNGSPYVITDSDAETGALFARNAWRAEFNQRVAFIDLGGAQTSCSGDRGTFLGRRGGIQAPEALSGAPLEGRVGAALDPCGALQAQVVLAPGQQVQLLFALGDAASADDARTLVRRYRDADLDAMLEEVHALWSGVTGAVQVKTPDRALDIMLNDWLLYQTLGCRIWGRSGYYQSSGAYGFRDQLQDVMALCVARPDVARAHIVRSAGRQFPEGDVQHWWLPPSGQGIRTTMSDDRLWLPYVAAHYVLTTGDGSVLDESVPFLDGPVLKPGQHEAFFQPGTSDETASVYEHGARAIDASLALGAHGLPLIGTGDWNDGMNRVGIQGKGESVWLAWFLFATIDAYAGMAESRGDDARVERWRQHAQQLREAVERSGWDGDWYRRGYYDDGTALGSAASLECRIDTIAQSWSAIAGATDQQHVHAAMDAVQEKLIRPDDGVALLFTPPFDDGPTDPGYIKGYPPGLRENGGQYTHGAIWSVFAFARLGQGNRAGALFDLLNPIHHADAASKLDRYRVEPYVACADVYSVTPHVGRGGWTWYTGSAGWLYRAGLEALLGFQLRGQSLLLEPCIPASWPGFEMTYRRGTTRYLIEVRNPGHVEHGVVSATLDGVAIAASPNQIGLRDDGADHRWVLTMGPTN